VLNSTELTPADLDNITDLFTATIVDFGVRTNSILDNLKAINITAVTEKTTAKTAMPAMRQLLNPLSFWNLVEIGLNCGLA